MKTAAAWVLLISWNANGDYVAMPGRTTLSECRAGGRHNVEMTRRWYPITWRCVRG